MPLTGYLCNTLFSVGLAAGHKLLLPWPLLFQLADGGHMDVSAFARARQLLLLLLLLLVLSCTHADIQACLQCAVWQSA